MFATIITDGSADNKTRLGGWCAIIRTPTSLVELVGHDENTTSNKMELVAAIEGLKSISVPSEITVITDSAYLLNTMRNKWYERWFQEDNPDRPNLDLWHQLVGLSHFHNITWIKIKGHSGDYWNERADTLADQARRNKLSSRHEIGGFNDGDRCSNTSPSDRRCKFHAGHSGNCYFTNGRANGVEPYGTSVTTAA